jgi:hypothetical protein
MDKDFLDALETVFIAAGKAGANSDLRHNLRSLWEQARAVLRSAGRLP